MENWRAISGYEGRYEVSDLGRVRSLDTKDALGRPRKGKILKPFKDTGGYMQVCLRNSDGQCNKNVHRLVAISFVEKPKGFNSINHKDENKENNRADNLEWCTNTYNANYGGHQIRAHLTLSKPVEQLVGGRVVGVYLSTLDAYRKTGINHGSISRCCNGGQKTSGGYAWRWMNEFEAETMKNEARQKIEVRIER